MADFISTSNSVSTTNLSREDLEVGVAVSLSTDAAYSSYLWELEDIPTNSVVTISNSTSSNATFTPDIAGSYRVKFTADFGLTTESVRIYRLSVPTQDGLILVTADERYDTTTGEIVPNDLTARGWAEVQNSNLRALEAFDLTNTATPYISPTSPTVQDVIDSLTDPAQGGDPKIAFKSGVLDLLLTEGQLLKAIKQDEIPSWAVQPAVSTFYDNSTSGLSSPNVQGSLDELAEKFTDIPATDVVVNSTGTVITTGDTVEAALIALDTAIGVVSNTDDQTATEVPFTPTGTVFDINVQSAIETLATRIGGLTAVDIAFGGGGTNIGPGLDVEEALQNLDTAIEDAKDSDNITFDQTNHTLTSIDVSSTTVEGALVDLDTAINSLTTQPLQNASQVPFAPILGIASINTQDAVEEVNAKFDSIPASTVIFDGGAVEVDAGENLDSAIENLDEVIQLLKDSQNIQFDQSGHTLTSIQVGSTDLESAIVDLDTAIGSITASDVAFTPVNALVATDTQGAISEVDTRIDNLSSADITYDGGSFEVTSGDSVESAIEVLDEWVSILQDSQNINFDQSSLTLTTIDSSTADVSQALIDLDTAVGAISAAAGTDDQVALEVPYDAGYAYDVSIDFFSGFPAPDPGAPAYPTTRAEASAFFDSVVNINLDTVQGVLDFLFYGQGDTINAGTPQEKDVSGLDFINLFLNGTAYWLPGDTASDITGTISGTGMATTSNDIPALPSSPSVQSMMENLDSRLQNLTQDVDSDIVNDTDVSFTSISETRSPTVFQGTTTDVNAALQDVASTFETLNWQDVLITGGFPVAGAFARTQLLASTNLKSLLQTAIPDLYRSRGSIHVGVTDADISTAIFEANTRGFTEDTNPHVIILPEGTHNIVFGVEPQWPTMFVSDGARHGGKTSIVFPNGNYNGNGNLTFVGVKVPALSTTEGRTVTYIECYVFGVFECPFATLRFYDSTHTSNGAGRCTALRLEGYNSRFLGGTNGAFLFDALGSLMLSDCQLDGWIGNPGVAQPPLTNIKIVNTTIDAEFFQNDGLAAPVAFDADNAEFDSLLINWSGGFYSGPWFSTSTACNIVLGHVTLTGVALDPIPLTGDPNYIVVTSGVVHGNSDRLYHTPVSSVAPTSGQQLVATDDGFGNISWDPVTVSSAASSIVVTPTAGITATNVQDALEDMTTSLSGIDDQTATEVPYTPAGTITSSDVQSAIQELDTDIQSLDAEAIQFDQSGLSLDIIEPTSINVELALVDLDAMVRVNELDVKTNEQDIAALSLASGIAYTPSSLLAATTVQGAIDEVAISSNIAITNNAPYLSSLATVQDTISEIAKLKEADSINYTNDGRLSATNVQDALDSLTDVATTSLTPYVVGPDATDPYNTLDSAVLAANSASTTSDNPAVILLKGGSYTLSAFPDGFISITSLVPSPTTYGSYGSIVTLSGSVTVTNDSRLNVSNIQLNLGNNNLTLGNNSRVSISSSVGWFNGTGAILQSGIQSALSITNSEIKSTNAVAGNPDPPLIISGSNNDTRIMNSVFGTNNFEDIAIVHSGTSLASQVVIEHSAIRGSIISTSKGAFHIRKSRLSHSNDNAWITFQAPGSVGGTNNGGCTLDDVSFHQNSGDGVSGYCVDVGAGQQADFYIGQYTVDENFPQIIPVIGDSRYNVKDVEHKVHVKASQIWYTPVEQTDPIAGDVLVATAVSGGIEWQPTALPTPSVSTATVTTTDDNATTLFSVVETSADEAMTYKVCITGVDTTNNDFYSQVTYLSVNTVVNTPNVMVGSESLVHVDSTVTGSNWSIVASTVSGNTWMIEVEGASSTTIVWTAKYERII